MDMDTRVSDFWELEVSLGYRVFRYYIKSQNQRQAILLSTYFLDGFIAKENQGWISKLIASLPSPPTILLILQEAVPADDGFTIQTQVNSPVG